MCRSSWRAQEIGSATPVLISPFVKQLAPDCQFLAQCRWALASQNPLDDAAFKLPTENSRALPHVTILLWMENVTRFRVSLFGVHSTLRRRNYSQTSAPFYIRAVSD